MTQARHCLACTIHARGFNSRNAYFFSFVVSAAASATFFCTSTASLLTVLATFFESELAIRPLGSQPAATEMILPPFSMRKLVGIVLVSNVFHASPLESTA